MGNKVSNNFYFITIMGDKIFTSINSKQPVPLEVVSDPLTLQIQTSSRTS